MKSMPTTCALCVFALAACSGHQLDDVERYVADLEADSGPALASLPEFAQLAPTSFLDREAALSHESDSAPDSVRCPWATCPLVGLKHGLASYQAGSRRSPFDPPAFGAKLGAQHGARGIAPDFSRARQPLEAFPASALSLVGTIAKGAVRRGLVVDGDGGVHEVSAGDYLGQNHGRIQRIGEAAIEFVEILPDGGGGWVERNRSLALAGPAP